jgi:hypothetical protein
MGKDRGPYKAEFPTGTCVRIAEREVLEQFMATWRLHHPLTRQQLEFAGRLVRVNSVGFYHGADELYELVGVPGTWHEELLRAASPQEAATVSESPRRPNRSRYGIATAVGLLSAVAVGCVLYFGTMLLGAATGVIAMCATAPEWWAFVFLGILFVCPLAGAILTGLKVGKWYLHRA